MLRRFPTYALLVLGTLAAEAALCAAFRADWSIEIAGMLFPPVLTALTYALVGRDEGVVDRPLYRGFQRCTLVIAIDFMASIAVAYALQSFSMRDVATGIALLAVNVSLIYADVFAVLETPADALLLLRSIGRSTYVAWNGVENIGRSFTLMALQLAPLLVSQVLQHRFELQHVPYASFWSQLALGTLLVPPLSALTALVYLDATGHEAKRTCGE